MRIFSKPFFTNYIIHPLSKDLTKGERAKALISSIAIGIFSLGICQAICAVKFHNRRNQHRPIVTVYYSAEHEKNVARVFLERVSPRNYLLRYEFTDKPSDTYGNNKRILAIHTPSSVPTEEALAGTSLGSATIYSDNPQRKLLLLINSPKAYVGLLRGPGWKEIIDRIVYTDSEPNQEIKGFFAPFAEEAPEESQDVL